MSDRTMGALVGEIKLICPLQTSKPNIRWTTFTAYQRVVYARGVAERARAFACELSGRVTAATEIDPANARSIILTERLGARVDPQAEAPDLPGRTVYRYPRPDALA